MPYLCEELYGNLYGSTNFLKWLRLTCTEKNLKKKTKIKIKKKLENSSEEKFRCKLLN